MKIGPRLLQGEMPSYSFEFFPPKSPEGVAALFATLKDLADLSPTFVSVTYGAGGSTRDLTADLVTRIRKETGIEAMAHLTCVGHSRQELGAMLDRFREAGIENVLALRGDPPQGQSQFVPAPDGFAHASELVAFIRGRNEPFSVGAACYPEGHIECPSREKDLEHLRRKVAAGVDFLITQVFYDNAFYFDFVERARRAGIRVPIVPGLMPITTISQIDRITRMCGATIPRRLELELEKRKANPEAVVELGVAHATVQCVELLARGAPGIHFYTLNRSPSTRAIVSALRANEPWRG